MLSLQALLLPAVLPALLLSTAALGADLPKSVKIPEGFKGTLFAKPPEVGYPTSVSAAADGTLFVAIDENGSLDAKPDRGKVLRCIDKDGDGVADEFKVFAKMDSPRGVIWDGATGTGPGRMYVMHPPNLTVYTDSDGDGVADKEEDLVKGLGFDLKFRGADHTTNGCRLAIDGWIYIAVGDYGALEAKGKDGNTLHMKGGGVVRVRTDGTGLEYVSRGQRNIYDVAVSPTLEVFTRDNTNDGGGWNDRLSFIPMGAHMGYPNLFVNFPEDIVPALTDFGGGSPCGSLWLDEPGLRKGLYTVEWGSGGIFYHDLKRLGAGYEKAPQEKWLPMTRPTDMDVDGSQRLYVSSWEGATFKYEGPNAGYLIELVKEGAKPAPVPDFGKLDDLALVRLVGSESATLRQTAQRELLRRGPRPGVSEGLAEIAKMHAPVNVRVAALFTLTQMFGEKTLGLETALLKDDEMREFALKAMGDDVRLAGKVPTAPLVAALSDKNEHVRLQAVTALGRLGKIEAAGSMIPLTGDTDPVIAHVAVRYLSAMNAADACLAALSSSDEKAAPGVLRALYGIYDVKVVDGLLARLSSAKEPALRRGILNALCRLDQKETAYEYGKWWTTRPDTTGPVYKGEKWAGSEKIEAAMKAELSKTDAEEAKWLVATLVKTKVDFPGLTDLMLAKAGTDTAAKLGAIEALVRGDKSLPADALKALSGIASNAKETPELRSRALRDFQKSMENKEMFEAGADAFATLASTSPPAGPLAQVWEEFTHDGRNAKHVWDFAKLATEKDAGKQHLGLTVLVNLAGSKVTDKKDLAAAQKALDGLWAKPETAAALLGVIAHTRAAAFAPQVTAHLKDPNNAVAEAALFAYQSLGLKDTGSQSMTIGTMKYEEVFAAVQKGGDPVKGKEMFLRAGCIACHTITPDEPPKGPILSAVAKIYGRPELTESILKPSAKIAQGFESVWFDTKKGEHIEGFVTRDGGDSLDVRNITGQSVTLEKGDIKAQGKREVSIMPEGLLAPFTPEELASLLAYLESVRGK